MESVVNEISIIFQSRVMLADLNQTLVTLIPKRNGVETLNSYRPISLCNNIYKVIAKVIVNRLRPFLDSLVSPLQTAFFPRRRDLSNVIIAQEIIHSLSP